MSGSANSSERLDAGLQAGFHKKRADDSVLAAIEKTAGQPVRVFLRDVPGDDPLVVRLGASRAQSGDRYQVVGEIARGGVGVVYKSRDVDLGRDVAMKVLKTSLAGNPELLQRFVEEAQIGGQLQHPGIVPVYELGIQADQRPFFTMKLVKGKTLAALLRGRADPRQDRRQYLGIFEQVCQTMAYAHTRSVVHRDLKPSNVMVGAFGEVQIVDWGFAKVLTGKAPSSPEAKQPDVSVIRTLRSGSPGSDSIAGSVLGTPAYMPPEQAWGDVARLDERSDVFSLGAILCEILTGSPAYTNEGSSAMVKAAKGELDDAHQRLAASKADRELIEIVRACLSAEPHDRPRNAEVVAARVSAHLGAAEERARASELAAAEARIRVLSERKARRLTTGIGAAIVVCIVLAGALFWKGEKDRLAEMARNNIAVREALGEAGTLEEEARLALEDAPARWQAALLAADRAAKLLDAGETDAATREEVERTSKRIGEGRKAAETIARRRALDAKMKERLEDLLTRQADPSLSVVTAQDYAQAFRSDGIDVENLSDDEAAGRIREREMAPELAAALDVWSGLEGDTRLLRIARAADTHALRRDARGAVIEGNLDALRAIVAKNDPELTGEDTAIVVSRMLNLAGDAEGATKFLRRALRHRSHDFWLNVQLADRLLKLRTPETTAALARYRTALALRPDSAMVRRRLADLLPKVNDTEGAVVALEDALRIEPDRLGVFLQLMELLQKQGNLQRRTQALLAAAGRNMEDPVSSFKVGAAHEAAGDLAQATTWYRRAIQLKDDNGHFHNRLGGALAQQERWKEAAAAYRKAIDLEPSWKQPRTALGRLLLDRARPEEAIRALEELLRITPHDLTAQIQLGMALRLSGRYDRARRRLTAIIESEPERIDAHLGLARLQLESGELEEAAETFTEAAQIDGENGAIYAELGLAYLAAGEFGQAEATLAWGEDYGADVGELIALCERLGELEDDEEGILSGAKQPDHARQQIDFATFCAARGKWERAAANFREGFTRRPNLETPKTRYLAATCAARASGTWVSQAREWLQANLKDLDSQEPKAVRVELLWWKRDRDLTNLRNSEFWRVVDERLALASE